MKIFPAEESALLCEWLRKGGRDELVHKVAEVSDEKFRRYLEQSQLAHPQYTPPEHWTWAAYTCLTMGTGSAELETKVRTLQRALRRSRFWTWAWQILVLLFLLFIALRVARSEGFHSGARPHGQVENIHVLDYEKEARR